MWFDRSKSVAADSKWKCLSSCLIALLRLCISVCYLLGNNWFAITGPGLYLSFWYIFHLLAVLHPYLIYGYQSTCSKQIHEIDLQVRVFLRNFKQKSKNFRYFRNRLSKFYHLVCSSVDSDIHQHFYFSKHIVVLH